MNDQIPFTSEIGRKGIHYSSLLISIFVGQFGRAPALWILVPLTVVAVSADIMRAREPAFHDWIDRYFGFIMRPHEQSSAENKIVLNGATWVLLAAVLTFSIFPKWVGVAAFSILILGDATAALVGRRFGQTHLAGTRKTWEGTAAFIISCIPLVFIISSISPVAIAIGILAGAAVELFPLPLNDNLRIPFFSGICMVIFLYATSSPIV